MLQHLQVLFLNLFQRLRFFGSLLLCASLLVLGGSLAQAAGWLPPLSPAAALAAAAALAVLCAAAGWLAFIEAARLKEQLPQLLREDEQRSAREAQLRADEMRYRVVAENISDWAFWYKPDGTYAYISPACKNTCGYEARELMADPQLPNLLVHPQDRAIIEQHNLIAEQRAPAEAEFRILHKDGSVRWIHHSCAPVFGDDGTYLGICGTNRDISAQKQAEFNLLSTKDRLEATLDALPDLMFRMDRFGNFLDCHAIDESHFFLPPAQFLGKNVAEIFSAETSRIMLEAMEDANKNGVHRGSEYSLPKPGGRTDWFEHSIARIKGPTDAENQFITLIRDVSRRKWAEQELREANAKLSLLATTDALTGVWNRRHGEEYLDGEIAKAQRYGQPLALLLLDIDQFKTINDRLGHKAGDQVLVEFSRRLCDNLRAADQLVRWGGEEFIVILPHCRAEDARGLAEKLRSVLSGQPIGEAGTVTASFGVAELKPGETRESWFRRADRALYQAKAAGRNSVSTAE